MTTAPLFVCRRAEFSPCRRYRYRLEIRWAEGRTLNFLMLNPSTADEHANDPTVERCERRAVMGGYGALVVTNLFAWRSTDPMVLPDVADPVGPMNDQAIIAAATAPGTVVICGWGVHGRLRNRDQIVLAMLRSHGLTPLALRITKHGHPEHPLYLPYSLSPRLMPGSR